MIKILEEKKEVVGVIHAQGQTFDLLDLRPNRVRTFSWVYRDQAYEFYVVVEGFAQYVTVSSGSFLIVPLLTNVTRTVKFLIDDEQENVKVQSLEE